MGLEAQLPLRERVLAEQLDAHYRQIPAMVTATTLGGLYTAWVLWDAVQDRYLVIGMSAVLLLSGLRLVLYRRYRAQRDRTTHLARWKLFAIAGAFVSGCIWGGAAPFLYPPVVAGYEVYLLVLLTLLPIIPVATLAVYMPAFYAYCLPCIAPFVATLLISGQRPELLAALLLVMMMGAMVTFARKYSQSLAQAVELRLGLAERTRALEEAIEHKTRFIAAASHDLRQPVHAMGLFVEALRRGRAGAADDEGIAYIEASLKALRRMLDDMLEVSRLDAAVVVAQQRDVAVAEVFERLRREVEPLAARQGLRFVCSARAAVVRSDPALLERMLRNLLANALKFTRRGGIALACRGAGETLRLQVIDTGCGIAAEHVGRIFEEFTQLDNAERNDAKGLGLGLAIVDRLAKLLGHGLTVRSVPGHGSTFTIEAAKGRAGDAGRAVEASAEPMPAEPPAAPGGCLVVVIDDDAAAGAGAAALLGQWGHRVLTFPAAAPALAALERMQASPDLLIVDYRLAHGESGLDAVTLLRRRLARPLPAIMLTGDTAPQRIRDSYAAGHTLLHKPVDPARLRASVAEALGGASLRNAP